MNNNCHVIVHDRITTKCTYIQLKGFSALLRKEGQRGSNENNKFGSIRITTL